MGEVVHEFSLASVLLKQVETIRRQEGAERVLGVRVSVGEFSGVEPDLFQEAFESLVAESALGEVDLQLNRVPLQSRCDDCDRAFAVERFRFQCPDCQSRRLTITGGQELVLESVTVEQGASSS